MRGEARWPAGLLGGVLAIALQGSACAPPPLSQEPAQVALRLRVKGSCGLSPVLFDTQCLAAVDLQVIDERGRTRARTCVSVADRYEDLGALLSAATPALQLGSIDSDEPVRFRILGLHDRGALSGGAPDTFCAAAEADAHWLFWGESAAVDLSFVAEADGERYAIAIPIDCRDCQNGCATLGTPQCPATFPLSYCVPYALGLSCERRCDSDDECFEGAHVCDADAGRCDPAEGHPETGNTGGFCYPCQSAADCDVGYDCVAETGQTEGICVRRCPADRCLEGATCRRLGADLRLLGSAAGL